MNTRTNLLLEAVRHELINEAHGCFREDSSVRHKRCDVGSHWNRGSKKCEPVQGMHPDLKKKQDQAYAMSDKADKLDQKAGNKSFQAHPDDVAAARIRRV